MRFEPRTQDLVAQLKLVRIGKPISYYNCGTWQFHHVCLSAFHSFVECPIFKILIYTLKEAKPDSTENVLLLKNPQNYAEMRYTCVPYFHKVS